MAKLHRQSLRLLTLAQAVRKRRVQAAVFSHGSGACEHARSYRKAMPGIGKHLNQVQTPRQASASSFACQQRATPPPGARAPARNITRKKSDTKQLIIGLRRSPERLQEHSRSVSVKPASGNQQSLGLADLPRCRRCRRCDYLIKVRIGRPSHHTPLWHVGQAAHLPLKSAQTRN